MTREESSSSQKVKEQWKTWGFKGRDKPNIPIELINEPSKCRPDTITFSPPEKPSGQHLQCYSLTQRTLQGDIASAHNNEHYGDLMRKEKPARYLCISGKNVNNVPEEAFWRKSKVIFNQMEEYSIDIMAFQEIGLDFRVLSPQNQWKERFRRRKGSWKSVEAFNTNVTP